MLPIETWLTFTRSSETEVLAGVLEGLLFDAAAPDFSPATMLEAVESGRRTGTTRMAPPRPDSETEAPESAAATDREDLRAEAERILAGRQSVSVVELVDGAGDWITARRVLAELTAAHLHDELDYEREFAHLTLAIERGCLKVVVSRSGCPSKPNHVGAEK